MSDTRWDDWNERMEDAREFADAVGSHRERMKTLHEISEEKRDRADMEEMRLALDWPIWEHEQDEWWIRGCPDAPH